MELLSKSGLGSNSGSQANVSIIDGTMNKEGKLFSFKSFALNVYKSSSTLEEQYSSILDTRATDHMCSNKSLFTSLIKLKQPHQTCLPNGHNNHYFLLW